MHHLIPKSILIQYTYIYLLTIATTKNQNRFHYSIFNDHHYLTHHRDDDATIRSRRRQDALAIFSKFVLHSTIGHSLMSTSSGKQFNIPSSIRAKLAILLMMMIADIMKGHFFLFSYGITYKENSDGTPLRNLLSLYGVVLSCFIVFFFCTIFSRFLVLTHKI